MSETVYHRTARSRRRHACASLLSVLGSLATAGASHAVDPQRASITPANLNAVLDTDDYGYDVTCIINGHDVGIKSDGSDSVRQFDESSKQGSTDPHDPHRYATLHLGRNTIRITYRRRPPRRPDEPDQLSIALQVSGYPVPLVYAFVAGGDQGSFESSFEIDAVPAKTYKPVYFTNEDPARSGFVFARQEPPATGSYSARLNGGDRQGETGQPSLPGPLGGFHPGANQLAVTYVTKGGPIHLWVVSPSGMTSYRLEAAKETTRTFVIHVAAPGGPAPTPPLKPADGR